MEIRYDGPSLAGQLTEAEMDALWPRKDVDPEFDEQMRAIGARIPTRSLDRPRVVVRPRPAWLAFLLRRRDAITALGRRIAGVQRKPSPRDLEFDRRLSEVWPVPDRNPYERSAPLVIRPATQSLDRPRHVARRRPGWLAFLLRMARVPD